MATKKKKTENPDLQAPKEDQEALWNALGHNSLADKETPGNTGHDSGYRGMSRYNGNPVVLYQHNSLADRETQGNTELDFETEYGHLTTQVPQLLKAILRELYLIRRAK